MRKLVVFTSLTLDGVMQAPGRPDEDTRGGFAHGGWAVPYPDEVMGRFLAERMTGAGALLLGRRTYEDLYGYWPRQPDNPLLKGDAAEAVAALKREPGGNLTVLGSGELVQALRRRDLVDEYVLLIHPLVLGTGRRLFPEGGGPATLRLTGSTVTTSGVIIATYQAENQLRRDA